MCNAPNEDLQNQRAAFCSLDPMGLPSCVSSLVSTTSGVLKYELGGAMWKGRWVLTMSIGHLRSESLGLLG